MYFKNFMHIRTVIISLLIILSLSGGMKCHAQTYATHSALAEGTWLKMAIAQTGLYRLTIADVPALQGCNVADIAVCGSNGRMLSENNAAARPDDLPQNAIDVHDANGNGLFDNEDYLIFYAEGPTTWRFNTASQRYEHTRHAYTNYNYYYLCTNKGNGLRIATSTITTTPSEARTTYPARALYEQDLSNPTGSGQIWLGEKFTSSASSRTFTLTLPNAPATSSIIVRLALANPNENAAVFTLSFNGTNKDIEFSSTNLYKTTTLSFAAGSSATLTFSLSYSSASSIGTGYLDYIEVSADAPLAYTGGQQALRITPTSTTTATRTTSLSLSNAPGNLRVWEVTPDRTVREMAVQINSGTAQFLSTSDSAREFVAFNGTNFLTPASITSLNNQDIHGANNPDYVIVTHSNFLTQATQLANLHSVIDGMEVLVVTQDQVYNEFSAGKQDPIAIRSMMRMFWDRARQNSSLRPPSHLLLFGKGTYDNRNILGNNLPTVATYQAPGTFSTGCEVSATDDIFGCLDANETSFTDGGIDINIGRLPAKSSAEASLMVNKIERYMTLNDLNGNDVRGDWRNYVTLLADDADPGCSGDVDFTESSEYLANIINNKYPWFNIDKIYADAYSEESGTIGSYYPDVNNALKQRIDYGTLLLNYIGHGSDQYIGTERYMELSDIDNYTNTDQLAFFVTSTCSFGKFDRLDGVCGSEAFVLAPAAGMAAVAAARPIAHIRAFNTAICINALNDTNTIGNAIRLAKNGLPTVQNRAVVLMGDPALKLSFPQYKVVVTAINGNTVTDGVTDTATVLSKITVEGEIQDNGGNLQSDFDGVIFPIVFDRSTRCHTLANDNEGTETEFTQQKNILYKGRDSVNGGHFSYTFTVPRDVAYQYGYGKLSHYAKSATTNATGQYSNIVFGGFNENISLSETHPEIRLFMNDSTFANGGITDENPSLFAILSDSVGINAVGSGIGHDITATIDGNMNNVYILNDFYETDIANPKRGYVKYTLANLTSGRHTLTLKAWNIFNYSNTATISFYVRNADTAQIGAFYSQPNPATDHTLLRIEHNSPTDISSAIINIYDITGRMVCQLSPEIAPNSYVVPINWDFRNHAGNTVGGGIYIARAILTTSEGETLTAITKIVKIK